MFSKFSVKKPYTVIVGIVLCLVLGVVSFSNMSTDLLPEMELPYMIVYTTYPGASAEKVEKSVTKVIESAVSTVSNLKNVTSTSSDNLSMVVLEFADDTNMDSVTIDISGKIDMVKGAFDDTVSSPVLMALNPNMLPIMEVAIAKDGMSQEEMSTIYSEDILPNIEKIDGVASVSTIGLLEQTIEVRLDQNKIDAVNDKVLKSVDEELWKAQQKIRDGWAELNDGQAKLDEGKVSLESGKQELEEKTSETITSLAEATAKLDTANATLQGVLANETDLNTSKAALEMEKKASEEGAQKIEEALGPLTAVSGPLDTLISSLVTYPDETPIENLLTVPGVSQLVDGLRSQGMEINTLKDLRDANTQIKTQIQTLNDTKTQLETRIPQIDIELTNIATELLGAKAAKEAIQGNIDQLTQAKTELEKGKMTASIQLANANMQVSSGEAAMTSSQAQLDSAREQLESAQQQLNDSRDDAYKAADISGMLTPSMVSNILMAENFSMPAGTISVDDRTSIMVKVGDDFSSIDELKNLTVFSMPDIEGLENVTLSDLATVDFADNSDDLYAKLNGENGIIVTVEKQSTASTAEVCRSVKKELSQLVETYNVTSTVLFDQGVYIDLVVDSVLQNLLQGGLLAILILLLFLKDWKPTLIIGISIPVSLLVAIVAMYFSGVTLNVISLAGLALGVGMLVDNSIVVIENIYRLRSEGVPLIEATVKGASSVSGAIIASTLTTVCVFLPIVFATGLAKQIFTDMGLTIAYSLVASLIIALTVVPMLSSKMLGKVKQIKHPWFDAISNFYSRMLAIALKRKLIVILTVVALLGVSVYQVTRMGTSFMPEVNGTQISISMVMDDDTATKEETREATNTLVDRLIDIEGIESVGAMQGQVSLMSTGGKDNTMSLYIILKEDRKVSAKEIAESIQNCAEDLPMTLDISTSNMDMSMLGGSGIQIVLKGNNLDSMYSFGNTIKEELQSVEGVDTITVGAEEPNDELRVIVDKNKAMQYGLTIAQIYSSIATDLSGTTKSTTISIEDKDYPVIIVDDNDIQSSTTALKGYTLTGTKKQESVDVRLDEVADFTNAQGATSISRENGQRTLTVNLTLEEGYNVGLVAKDVESKMHSVPEENGVTYGIEGESSTINETMTQLVQMIALAIVFIYLIMVAQFQNLLSPFIVMFTIPLAFTGGLLALLITGNELSVISMLGFLVLSGIVVNNGIVFIDTVNQLREEGMEKTEALLLTGKTRLRPILMTALTTILGLSTMALGIGQGAEMMAPLAIVTIGGLIYATLMTLFIVPVLYDIFQRKDRKKIEVEFNGTEE